MSLKLHGCLCFRGTMSALLGSVPLHRAVLVVVCACAGIDMREFAEVIMTSGVVLNEDIKWITFHAGFDFAYLVKILSCQVCCSFSPQACILRCSVKRAPIVGALLVHRLSGGVATRDAMRTVTQRQI